MKNLLINFFQNLIPMQFRAMITGVVIVVIFFFSIFIAIWLKEKFFPEEF